MAKLLPESFKAIGRDLHRPECVVGAPNGDVYVSDWRGGVAVVRANGAQQAWLADNPGIDFKPNGVGFLPNGNFLIANLGADGGIWAMDLSGAIEPILTDLEGRKLPPANFAYADREARVWASISTRMLPRQRAWRTDVKDGFVVCIDKAGARIVADNLHYTNEVRVDPAGQNLYVVETFGRRLIAYPIGAGGKLGDPKVVAQFESAFFPDGFAFDVEGGIWVTSLVSNRVERILPNGARETILADTNAAHAAAVNAAFESNQMATEHLGKIAGTRFQQVTSISFGGADRQTAWLGGLHTDCLFEFRSDVAGAAEPHWTYDLP